MGLVALVAQGELYGVMVKRHRQPATAVGLVSGALVLAGAYFHGEAGLMSMLSIGVLATFLWYLTVPAPHRKDVVGNIGLTLLGLLWIPGLAGSLLVILTGFETSVVVAVIALTFVFDTVAFVIGSVWGGSFVQRPLAPASTGPSSTRSRARPPAAASNGKAALFPGTLRSKPWANWIMARMRPAAGSPPRVSMWRA